MLHLELCDACVEGVMVVWTMILEMMVQVKKV